MDLIDKFTCVKEWYEAQDRSVREQEGKPFFATQYGLWGAAGMLDAFEFFMKTDSGRFRFADYGSGDGRIVLIAALFGEATGVEGDEKLVRLAVKAKEELQERIPELKRARFKQGDYYEENHADYDLIFFFPDHAFPVDFQEDLLKRFHGYVLVYNKIHSPNLLTKGKTYWVQQVPIVSYVVNIPEQDLFGNSPSSDEQ